MSKKSNAGPSATAVGAGAINTDTSEQGGTALAESGTTEVVGQADTGSNDAGAGAGDVVTTGAAVITGDIVVEGAIVEGSGDTGGDVEGPSIGVLEWAASLEYPVSTALRNNGHFTVVEPETAQIIGGGGVVAVTLVDEGHAVRVLDNTVTLNALHFHGELKVRLDAAPDDLYLKG